MRRLLALVLATLVLAGPALAQTVSGPAVPSVNGKRGNVVLGAADVGAAPCPGSCVLLPPFFTALASVAPTASQIDVRTAIGDAPGGPITLAYESGHVSAGDALAAFIQARYSLSSGQMATVFTAAGAATTPPLSPLTLPTLAQLGGAAKAANLGDLANMAAARGNLGLGPLATLTDAGPAMRTATGASTSRSFADAAADFMSVTEFGAACDGTTDDTAALNTALNSGVRRLMVPSRVCYAAGAVVGPASADIEIDGVSLAPGNPATGSTIRCAATVSPCLTLGGNNRSLTVRNLLVDRAGGKPAPTLTGLLVVDAYNALLDNVMSHNHGRCFAFQAHNSTGLGLGGRGINLNSGACSGTHVLVDSWPELRISSSRFGMNGLGDYDASSYVQFIGTDTSTNGGPNTIEFQNDQFNQGSTLTHYWLDFVNLDHPATGGNAQIFHFDNVHVEAMDTCGVHSDASWNYILGLSFTNSTYYDNLAQFLCLNAATSLETPIIKGNNIQTAPFTYAPNNQLNQWNFSDNVVNAKMTVVAPVNSQAVFDNNTFTNGITVSGFSNGVLSLTGGAVFPLSTGLNITGLATTTLKGVVNVPGWPTLLRGVDQSIYGNSTVSGNISGLNVFANAGLYLLGGDNTLAIVTVGPSGSGPGGTGRALYVTH